MSQTPTPGTDCIDVAVTGVKTTGDSPGLSFVRIHYKSFGKLPDGFLTVPLRREVVVLSHEAGEPQRAIFNSGQNSLEIDSVGLFRSATSKALRTASRPPFG